MFMGVKKSFFVIINNDARIKETMLELITLKC